jgi:hypothetical protein
MGRIEMVDTVCRHAGAAIKGGGAMKRAATAIALWVFGGPALAQSPPASMVKTRLMPPTYAVATSEFQLRRFDQPGETAQTAYAFLADRTRLILSPGAPVQVSYTGRDGAVRLWFPESGHVLGGKWHVEMREWRLMENGVAIKTRFEPSICFDYSGPVPNVFAPEWQRGQCAPLDGVRRRAIDRRDGDVMGLVSGQPRAPLGRIAVKKLQDLPRQR